MKLTSLLNNALPFRIFVVATGAGSGIQDRLWEIPGASAFLHGAAFPYALEESAAFAGLEPASYSSQDFAIDLAMAAFQRAIDVNSPLSAQEPVGLAVTASVAGLKEHRGEHRAHIVCMTRDRVEGVKLGLPKGVGEAARAHDGAAVDNAALELLLHTVHGQSHERMIDLAKEARKRLFDHPAFLPGGKRETLAWVNENMTKHPFFAGAFDPPHEGHVGIVDTVSDEYHRPLYTICANPPHKGDLNVQEMLRRAKLLRRKDPTAHVVFTENDPLFIEKARAYPGRPLVIGADSLLRMFDPKWGPDPRALYDELQQLKTQFLVFGRVIEGEYMSPTEAITKVWDQLGFVETKDGMRSVHLDYKVRAIFTALAGRWDISSTDLRLQKTAPIPAAETPAPAGDSTRSDAPAQVPVS